MHGSFYRRNLPHWDVAGATYFSTMCLEGSTPARGKSPHRTQNHSRPASATGTAAGRRFVAYDKLLDEHPAVRWLEDRTLAAVIAEAFHWGAATRYDLIAYVVMPSHVHWVFRPLLNETSGDGGPRLAITTAFKRHTAMACNRLLGRQGRFWQEESYDRVVRDEQELERIVRYVEYNPVQAGLCARPEEWEFSSARRPL